MDELRVERVEAWAPHAKAAPVTAREGDTLSVASNGTRFCVGGWQVTYVGVEPGSVYEMTWANTHREVAEPRDSLRAKAFWSEIGADQSRPEGLWQYLVPGEAPGAMSFSRQLVAPEDASVLTLRCTFRWSQVGESDWEMPTVRRVADAARPERTVRIAVVTGAAETHRNIQTLADNTSFYLSLSEEAIADGAELIVLPEIALQWGVGGHAYDVAVPVTSPETKPFANLARSSKSRILLGMIERDGDAVHNSAVLLGPDGVEGVYRKVHLAVGGESESGILPGDEFPVFDTPVGRIGCNICMDSSAAESSRMVGLNGAEILLLPIMGDHRASRWSPGRPLFNESRWRAIMRTHAIDTQACLAVARNQGAGSCIIDRRGDILAWNDGEVGYVAADVRLDDGYRTWNGGCFRDVNWMQRRPHLYSAFADRGGFGGVAGARGQVS